MKLNRREFSLLFTSAAGASIVSGCRLTGGSELAGNARISARPRDGVKTSGAGEIRLGLDRERDALLHLPKRDGPLPLLVMLHGATQSADDMFGYLGKTHDEAGVAVLAPNSRDTTWDAILGDFGPDVEFVNRALERVFETTAIDPARVSIGGFSDGASYALSLGLINGDLFHSVVAFSPGFVIKRKAQGKPRVYISHGTYDHILPIASCGKQIAFDLKMDGYDVTFREFDGDHEIPAGIAREGLQWV